MPNSTKNANSISRLKSTFNPFYKKSRSSIILRGTLKGKSTDFQTSIRCSQKQFKSDPEIYIAIDEHLEMLANAIISNKTTVDIRKAYYLNFKSSVIGISLSELVSKFITQYQGIMVPDYLRKFKTLLHGIMNFSNENDSINLPASWLDNDNMNAYTTYLLNLGLENSTIKGHLKRFRRLAKYAHDELGLNQQISTSLIKLKEKQPFIVFLNNSEVKKFAMTPTKTPGELEVKNGFLFRCYTGIRFSELAYIDINNFDGQVLSFYIPKTSKSHQIPLNRKALELLQKVERFNPISQQKENKYIKILAKRALIDGPVQKVKLSGSVSTVTTYPKWELCSSHTARRTWARIAYETGIDILKISRYIGHSDISTTLKYIGHKDTDFDELKNLFN